MTRVTRRNTWARIQLHLWAILVVPLASGLLGCSKEPPPSRDTADDVSQVTQAAAPCASITCPSCYKCQAGACVVDNGAACADDGNPCSQDVCAAGLCVHTSPEPSSTVCRAASDACDNAELCTGVTLTCPVDSFRPTSVVCRTSAGTCDVAESCTGSAAACPADTVLPSSTICRAASGACGAAESCTGSAAACPADVHAPSTTACRAAVDACDAVEYCGGASTTCPSDLKSPSGTACADDGNPCTPDQCNGSSDVCQHPAGNAGAVCRAAAGECDAQESCTGSSTACPADAKLAALAPCTDDGSVCTADVCNGSSNTCTHPAGNAGTVCRSSAGECDIAESCDGVSTACASDAFRSAGVVCRAAADGCDSDEACSGSAAACPGDVTSPDGTPCDDGTLCTQSDRCMAGHCWSTTIVSCPASDACHTAGACDPTTGQCSAETELPSCNQAELDYVSVSVAYSVMTQTTVVSECNATNNWSATKGSPLSACENIGGGEPQPFTVTRLFHGVCPSGTQPYWLSFGYTTTTPADTKVEFRFRSFPAVNGVCTALAAVTTSPPLPIATASLTDDPQSCLITGSTSCPMVLGDYLGPGNWSYECLQMDAIGIPSTIDGPTLVDWSVTHDCRENR